MSLMQGINEEYYNLISIACLFLSHKIEEPFQYKLEQFINAQGNESSPEEVQHIEESIVATLGFNLTTETMNAKLSRVILLWDKYVAASPVKDTCFSFHLNSNFNI